MTCRVRSSLVNLEEVVRIGWSRVDFGHENVGVVGTQPGTTQHGCALMHCTWKSDLNAFEC